MTVTDYECLVGGLPEIRQWLTNTKLFFRQLTSLKNISDLLGMFSTVKDNERSSF